MINIVLSCKLTVVKLRVKAFFIKKLIVIARFDNVAVLHDDYYVSFSDG